MSKRVYEIARELNLSTKEVIERLNAAGIEVKSHFAVVQDSVVERVFGEGSEGDASDGTASNGHSQAQDVETLPTITRSPPGASRSGIQWLRKDSLPVRVLVYVAAAMLVVTVAAGVGATVALMLQGNLSPPEGKEPRASGQQGNTPQHRGAVANRPQKKVAGEQPSASRSQEQKSAAQPQEKAASQTSVRLATYKTIPWRRSWRATRSFWFTMPLLPTTSSR